MTQPTGARSGGTKLFQRPWTWWFTVAVLVIVAAGRLWLLNFPLERDEGEYAYAGQLMLQGIPPYELAYNMKFPGTYAAYAVIMKLFGQTPAGIHFGLLLLTTATALMLYRLGKKILDEMAGVVAATAYAVMAASSAVFGFAGHATHFCAFFATAGLYALWKSRQNAIGPATIAAGLSFGLAILMKQHAVLIALWAAMSFAVTNLSEIGIPFRRRWAAIAIFGAAMILPLGLCCLMLWAMGVFGQFRFWTIDYAREYVSIARVTDLWPQLSWSLHSMISDCWLWWFGFAGIGMVWLDNRLRETRLWLLGFTLAAALATSPGFYFRTHYFLLLLPALALLAGCAVSGVSQRLRQKTALAKFSRWPAVVYGLVLAFTLFRYADVWSVLGRAGGHALYGSEPFPEAGVVAEFIRAFSPPNARIAVLGSEPEIYFLARRHSATAYIYTYALMEPQPFARRMQDEMIRQISTNAPEFIVFANIGSSWQQRPESEVKIFNWWTDYQTNYDLVGVADMARLFETRYFWYEGAVRHGKPKDTGLEIYRRKTFLPPSTSPNPVPATKT